MSHAAVIMISYPDGSAKVKVLHIGTEQQCNEKLEEIQELMIITDEQDEIAEMHWGVITEAELNEALEQ